jgi:hypothetical protein
MKKNDILLILIPLFLFVISWIGFSIYHNIVTSTISQPLSVQITPINPTFDTSTIDSLKNREKITPVYELDSQVQNVTTIASTPANLILINPVTSNTTIQATNGGSLIQ